MSLDDAFELQHNFQREVIGSDPRTMEGNERIQFIKDMNLALQDELHELLDEVGWKPWATSRHVNEEAAKGELVDAFHFFMNLCLVLNMGPEELFDRYLSKLEINLNRQRDGYDGVSTKCPGCGRALDDKAVGCYRFINHKKQHMVICNMQRATYDAATRTKMAEW